MSERFNGYSPQSGMTAPEEVIEQDIVINQSFQMEGLLHPEVQSLPSELRQGRILTVDGMERAPYIAVPAIPKSKAAINTPVPERFGPQRQNNG